MWNDYENKIIPIEVALEFLLVFVLLTPDKMELA